MDLKSSSSSVEDLTPSEKQTLKEVRPESKRMRGAWIAAVERTDGAVPSLVRFSRRSSVGGQVRDEVPGRGQDRRFQRAEQWTEAGEWNVHWRGYAEQPLSACGSGADAEEGSPSDRIDTIVNAQACVIQLLASVHFECIHLTSRSTPRQRAHRDRELRAIARCTPMPDARSGRVRFVRIEPCVQAVTKVLFS
jgi:hypothetical protein